MDKTSEISSSNIRIAKNTIYLYIRTFISILITFYTSRIFLEQLGFEDFGIYNLVGGIITLFGVLNSMMASATQRFLSVEIGKKNGDINKILNISITIHLVLAVVFICVGEVGGIILLKNFLKIPSGKEILSVIVFQISLLTAAVGLIKIPYNALIIARERMSFYAYLTIFEVVAKLFVTMILTYFTAKLLLYSSLYLLVTIIIVGIYYFLTLTKCVP